MITFSGEIKKIISASLLRLGKLFTPIALPILLNATEALWEQIITKLSGSKMKEGNLAVELPSLIVHPDKLNGSPDTFLNSINSATGNWTWGVGSGNNSSITISYRLATCAFDVYVDNII